MGRFSLLGRTLRSLHCSFVIVEQYYYRALDVLSLSFPLAASFERRLFFRSKWPGLFLGTLVMAVIFLAWDAAFTSLGVWGFNPRYVIGVYFLGMPIEEWLFFLFIPYSCLFLYEVMRHFVIKDVLGQVARPLSFMIIVLLIVVGVLNWDRLYTTITFISTALLLAYHLSIAKAEWLGRFYVGYAISLVPFLLVNGILTGWLLPEPIVWYNDNENLGLRINTIPIEDPVYLMMMMLIILPFYERYAKRDITHAR